MRVISKDGTINVPYEGNMFCYLNSEEDEIHSVVVRTSDFTKYMPLADYDTEAEAKKAFDDLAAAGRRSVIANDTFQFC